MQDFERNLIIILNDWYDNLQPVEESDCVKYEFAKHKFRSFYLKKTGEFLKISQRTESAYFNRIASVLSKKYEVNDALMNQYLEWCFENYDIFLKKYSGFNLNSIALFAENWSPDLYKFEETEKPTLNSLNNIYVKDLNIFECFENFGIALTATKLSNELKIPKTIIENKIKEKLITLTTNQENLNRLKNMLRITVENAPYTSEVIFKNFKESLKEFFVYFTGELWAR